MPQVNALIAAPRLKKGSAGATSNAATTGPALSFDEVRYQLWNWSRWAATYLPELGVQPPPWAEYWIPNLAWDAEWGDGNDGGTVDLPPPKIDEQAAEWMDKLVMRLPIDHLLTIKNQYIKQRRQPRDKVDAAIRALGDIL